MIVFKTGDIFSSTTKCTVNTINCVGAMGKGIALLHRERYPEQYKEYREKCFSKQIHTGNVYFWKGTDYGYDRDVLWFPTKFHWKNPSTLEYIESGLKAFVNSYEKMGITSIAFPKLGCSNGGLKWEDVKPLMVKYLENLPIEIEIYE